VASNEAELGEKVGGRVGRQDWEASTGGKVRKGGRAGGKVRRQSYIGEKVGYKIRRQS
jgi:hypothetical protein